MQRKSPTARHRRLMSELNRLRDVSGLSRAEVAERIGTTDTTVWRYETGLTRPKVSDVAALLDVYGVTGDARDELLEGAREARKRGWWHRYRQTLKPGFDSYIGLEAEASVLRTFQPQVVPGVLQTAEYARTVIQETSIVNTPSDIDEKVAVRTSRQELLTRSSDPIHLTAVLDEAVLRRQVGGAEVMKEQLEQLILLTKRPNIDIRVLPFHTGAHAGLDGQFNLLEFPAAEDPDVVYLEQAGSGLVPEDPEEVRRYTLIFGNLMTKSLPANDSRAFLSRVVKGDG